MVTIFGKSAREMPSNGEERLADRVSVGVRVDGTVEVAVAFCVGVLNWVEVWLGCIVGDGGRGAATGDEQPAASSRLMSRTPMDNRFMDGFSLDLILGRGG